MGSLLENLFNPHMLVVKPTKIDLGPPPPSGIRQTKISPEPTKVKKKNPPEPRLIIELKNIFQLQKIISKPLSTVRVCLNGTSDYE